MKADRKPDSPVARDEESVLATRQAQAERMDSLAVLASGVAHDLNNLLMPLVAYPDLLLPHFSEGSQEYEDMMEIKRSALKAADIVKDLTAVARRGKYPLHTVNLNSVINEFFDSAVGRALKQRDAGAKVEVLLGENLWPMPGSSPHLAKAFEYLVDHALRAMGDGGGVVTLCTENKRLEAPMEDGFEPIPEGEYVVLTVRIPGGYKQDADLSRLFEPFYCKKRMDMKGTGLSMSLLYSILKDHAGFVDVRCAHDKKRTTFQLYWPKGEVQVKSEPPASSSTDLKGTETILVVDDLPEQREVAKRLLTRLGYRTLTAANGREAVDLARSALSGGAQRPFDLVITDMIMEDDFDGLETCREIRKVIPDQKCIIVSGYSESDRVRSALKAGAGAFVRKPYTVQILGRAVREELDRVASVSG